MAETYRARQGEMLDLICWRIYGTTTVTETVLGHEKNRHLRFLPPRLPIGTIVHLPEIALDALPAPQVKLWD